MTAAERLRARLLETWPGRWQLAIDPDVDPVYSVAYSIAKGATPVDAISNLIASGHFEVAEELLHASVEPAIADGDQEELDRLLVGARQKTRRGLERTLDGLERQAARAGRVLPADRAFLTELSELDHEEVVAAVRELEQVVEDFEATKRQDLLARLDRQSPSTAVRERVTACLARGRWDAAERLLLHGGGPAVAAQSPMDVPEPPTLRSSTLTLVSEILRYRDQMCRENDWADPGSAGADLLELLVRRQPDPVQVAFALDRLLQPDSTTVVEDDRVILTSMEILPVPRPRFVGPRGLVICMPGADVGGDDVLLDVGTLETPGGPRLGVSELVRIVLSHGDRRIALLRLIARQQRARKVVPDLAAVANIDWALDWAFDLAAPRVTFSLVDVVLGASGGRPGMTEELFVAALPPPTAREAWLTEDSIEDALQDPHVQERLVEAFLHDLDGDPSTLDLLRAVDALGQPDPGLSPDDLEQWAATVLGMYLDDEVVPEVVRRVLRRVHECGYLQTDAEGVRFVLGPLHAIDPVLLDRALEVP